MTIVLYFLAPIFIVGWVLIFKELIQSAIESFHVKKDAKVVAAKKHLAALPQEAEADLVEAELMDT